MYRYPKLPIYWKSMLQAFALLCTSTCNINAWEIPIFNISLETLSIIFLLLLFGKIIILIIICRQFGRKIISTRFCCYLITWCRVPPKKEVDWHIFHSFHTHERDCKSTYFCSSKVKNSIIIWSKKKSQQTNIT